MEPQCLCTEPESVRRLHLARGVLQRAHDVGVLAVSPFRNDFDIARALREIAFYQKHTGLCLPRTAFARVVKEVMSYFNPGLRIQSSALAALQEGTEHILVTYLELVYLQACRSVC
jgi:histone H3/H4